MQAADVRSVSSRSVQTPRPTTTVPLTYISSRIFLLSSSVSMLSSSTSIMAAVNSAVNVSATCIGSLMPLLSMTTYSTSFDLAKRASSESRSPRRVQQMQPFCSWMSFSFA